MGIYQMLCIAALSARDIRTHVYTCKALRDDKCVDI